MIWVILSFQLFFIMALVGYIILVLTRQHIRDREEIARLIRFIKPDTYRKNAVTKEIETQQQQLFEQNPGPGKSADDAVIRLLNRMT